MWEQEQLVVRHFMRMQTEGLVLEATLNDPIGSRLAPGKCHWRARSASDGEVLLTTVRGPHTINTYRIEP